MGRHAELRLRWNPKRKRRGKKRDNTQKKDKVRSAKCTSSDAEEEWPFSCVRGSPTETVDLGKSRSSASIVSTGHMKSVHMAVTSHDGHFLMAIKKIPGTGCPSWVFLIAIRKFQALECPSCFFVINYKHIIWMLIIEQNAACSTPSSGIAGWLDLILWRCRTTSVLTCPDPTSTVRDTTVLCIIFLHKVNNKLIASSLIFSC